MMRFEFAYQYGQWWINEWHEGWSSPTRLGPFGTFDQAVAYLSQYTGQPVTFKTETVL